MDQLTTALITIMGGVVVFASGQIAVKLFIEPLQEQYKSLNQIAIDLTFYQNQLGHGDSLDPVERDKVIDAFRRHASNLRASAWTIKWYRLWAFLKMAPARKNILTASAELIGLSNIVTARTQADWTSIKNKQAEIRRLLKFE